MKKWFLIFAICLMPYALHAADYSAADYSNYDTNNLPPGTIAKSAPMDMTADAYLTLNAGAGLANVASFDIAGAMLGMTFDQVQNLFINAANKLYAPVKTNAIVYSMSDDWRYNLDYECRARNIFVPAELEKCINSTARGRGLLYAAELHLERPGTGETITLYFTSNMTGNKVYRIFYRNDANMVMGTAEKFENQRVKKIMSFWQGVVDKYGQPNSGTDRWISSDNAFDPMMTAYYGALDLVDQGMYADDAGKNTRSAVEEFPAKPYAF